ncbi:MAG: HDOD domain-containing protein [Pseudomonadota bacterium]
MSTNAATEQALTTARDTIASIRMLPPLPAVAVEIISKLGDEFIDGNEVADVVAQDPAICARLISLANSAYFGLQTPVGNMRDVVNRVLGVDTVRSMALALASQQSLDTSGCERFDERRFWRTALGAAASCHRIAAVVEELTPAERSCAYPLGLCHDLGLMALVAIEPARMNAAFAGDPSLPTAERVEHEFGFRPEAITLALAEHWELPLLMIDTYRARMAGVITESPMVMVLQASIRAADFGNDGEHDPAEVEAALGTEALSVPDATLAAVAVPDEKQRAALDGAVEAMTG